MAAWRLTGAVVLVGALGAAVGNVMVQATPLSPECSVLAGDLAIAEQLCVATRDLLATRPDLVPTATAARLLLEVVDATATRIVARLVDIAADGRHEGQTLILEVTDRAILPAASIAGFAQTLVTQFGLSRP